MRGSGRQALEAAAVFVVALVVYSVLAAPYGAPPYMDAYYYVDAGRSLAAGQGLVDHFIWNYLPPPPAITHPGSTYWLPLFSLLIAGSLTLFGPGYAAERLPALVCAAAYVALTYALARWLMSRERGEGAPQGTARPAVLAAGLVLFNGIWAHDFTGPDSFVAYAVLATASLALWGVAACRGWSGAWLSLGAGLMAGLAMLTRQEGLLLLPAALLVLPGRAGRRGGPRRAGRAAALYLAGVALAVSPWLAHLRAVGGGATGGLQTVWLRSYADFFSYGAAPSPGSYLAWGLSHILASKVTAGVFLVALWVYLWQVVLVPVLVIGLVRWRGHPAYRSYLRYAALVAALPFVVTFPSLQGTLAHASVSLLGFAACAIAAAFEHLGRARGERTRWVLAGAVLAGAGAVTLWSAHRSFDATAGERVRVRAAVAWLDARVPPTVPAMVDDPPAFAYFSPRPVVIVPSNGLSAVVAVARRYGVGYWVAGAGEGSAASERAAWGLRQAAVLKEGVTIYRFAAPTARKGPGRRR